MRHAAFCTSLFFAAAVASACECPPQAQSKDPVIASSRFVVCGHTDAVEEKSVKASELQLFECGRDEPLLQLGALQTARIERNGDEFRITEVGRWPWGPNWESIEVPEARWSIIGGHAESVSILPPPRVTAKQVSQFLEHYKLWLGGDRSHEELRHTDIVVELLFAAAVSGNAEAQRFFDTMPADAHLDGAAAETYQFARARYEQWRHDR